MTYSVLWKNVGERNLLGKGVQRCHSLPSVALRSFLSGTHSPKTQHGKRFCCAQALFSVVGAAAKAGDEARFLMSKNYSWKICYLQIIPNNIYQL